MQFAPSQQKSDGHDHNMMRNGPSFSVGAGTFRGPIAGNTDEIGMATQQTTEVLLFACVLMQCCCGAGFFPNCCGGRGIRRDLGVMDCQQFSSELNPLGLTHD